MDMDESTQNRARARGLTLRAFLVGAAIVLGLCFASPYFQYVVHTTLLYSNYLPIGVTFPFLLVVAVLNVVLKAIKRTSGFSPEELTVIFIMVLVGGFPVGYGLTSYLLSNTAAPYYFASPENRWAEYFHEYIPRWIAPQNLKAMKWFYEGLPEGESIPWNVWLVPLAWWLPLMGAMLVANFSLATIMRRQWVERERLVFPLTEVPLTMVEESASPHLMPKFMRSKLFWVGFGVTFFAISWNMMSWFRPELIPQFQLNWGEIRPLPTLPPIAVRLSLLVLGLIYLVRLDVSLSIWLFYALGLVQQAIFNKVGFTIGAGDTYSSNPPAMAWQGWGGFIVLVGFSLYLARGHLKDVFHKAWNRNHPVDDSQEMTSYRAAVIGLVVSLSYIMVWFHRAGMPLVAIIMFVLAVLVIYIGVTRCVIDAGLVFVRSPLNPQSFVLRTLGHHITTSGGAMTSMAFSYVFLCDPICIFLPFAANAVKLSAEKRISRTSLSFAIIFSVALGMVGSILFTIYLAYSHGAFNFGGWIFGGGAVVPFNEVVTKMRNPVGPDANRLICLGAGAAFTAFVMFMRLHFPWWFIHPIGFTVAAVIQIRWCMFSIFTAWLTKLIIIRIGGLSLYQKAKPFFIGLIIGHAAGAGLGTIVDVIFWHGQGHSFYLF